MGRVLSRRHVILIGLSGAGKSTVGPLAAGQLGLAFVDLDAEVRRRAGKPIPAIFAEDGEAAFRAHEARAMAAALAGPPAVIAAGGGWAAQPGALEAAGDALVVWLDVDPETAAARLGAADGRPLLDGDPPGRLAELAAARRAFYAQADARVVTDGRSAAQVAGEVAALARTGGA